jgi:hypothetical protein
MVEARATKDGMEEAQADIDAWNKKNPNNKITNLNIKQSEKSRERYSNSYVDGRYVAKRYIDTTEKFNWTN